ncbi:MAG: alpha/beta hydrolase [Bosea sp. (in: a-proteobacteria)]
MRRTDIVAAWRCVGALLLAAALAGCAGRPPSALAPVAPIPANAHVVELLVSTTRREAADPAVLFSGERQPDSHFASLSISIPPGHVVGDISWAQSGQPDPATHFAAAGARRLAPADFTTTLRQRIARTGRSHVLVFVHGYNTRFDEAAFRFAQIVHDSGAKVTPVLFSWASWGTVSAYPYDRVSAEIARNGLESLLTKLANDPSVSEVSLLAHSMGGWLAMEAIRQMAIRNGRINGRIRSIMLAAPDIDIDVAMANGRDFGSYRPKVSLFVSRDDRALDISRFIWGSRDRLGSIDPDAEPYRSNLAKTGVDVIDLTSIKTGDSTGHAKFAQSAEVVRSIGSRLAAGQSLGSGSNVTEQAGLLTQGTINAVGQVLTAPLTLTQPSGPTAGGSLAP